MTNPDKRAVCANARRVVIKIGSNVLVGGSTGVVDRAVFAPLVQSIAGAANQGGRRIVLVSSGAVALGRRRVEHLIEARNDGPGLARLQAMAALGQSALMQLYEHEFGFHDLLVGQVLLTQADIDDRRRFINARHTLKLLSEELGAIPIVNENDTVANDEIRLGDNDRLAALVASLFDADLLLVLSDVDGLYTANPETDPAANVIPEVDPDDSAIDALVWESAAGPGRGGMASKIAAARVAAKIGVPTVIAPGRAAGVVDRVLRGESLGTLLVPPSARDRSIGARRLWLLHGITTSGAIHVDAGAASALCKGGKSLLPSGITAVDGPFGEGAAVDIVDPGGDVIARGLVAYASTEIARIAGHQSSAIVSILGFKRLNSVVHRDDLVLI